MSERATLEWPGKKTSEEAARYHMTIGFVAVELYECIERENQRRGKELFHYKSLCESLQREAKAENARLKAIVDMLPKTADGVPVVPGMAIWCERGHLAGASLDEGLVFCDGDGCFESGDAILGAVGPGQYEFRDCYSTRELAEKAKEQKQHETA